MPEEESSGWLLSTASRDVPAITATQTGRLTNSTHRQFSEAVITPPSATPAIEEMPAIAPQAFSVTLSAIGGLILLISGLLFLFNLATAHRQPAADAGAYRFSVPVHPVRSVPIALNTFAIWVALMIGLTVTNYGYPILSLAARSDTSVPAVYVGAQ